MLSQCLVIDNPTKRRTFTGMEFEYAKYTFGVKAPCDMEVIRVNYLYSNSMMESFRHCPLKSIVYRDIRKQEYGLLELPMYHSLDTKFGFLFEETEALRQNMSPGSFIPKDTPLLRSPNVDDDGEWRISADVNVALMSLPDVGEDGIVVTDHFCEQFTTNGIETLSFELGQKGIPINYHGNYDIYKIFPDIGERVGSDGVLAYIRSHNEDTFLSDMTPTALQEPDYIHDRPIFVKPGSEILDIRVTHRGHGNPYKILPDQMTTQLEKYNRASTEYHAKVVNAYTDLAKTVKSDKDLPITPFFSNAVTNSLVHTNGRGVTNRNFSIDKLVKGYCGKPQDEWRIEITYRYKVKPTIGDKVSGFAGDKGVITDVIRNEDAPHDAKGHRADLISEDKSTIGRMNLYRLYEMYFGAAAIEIEERIRAMFGLPTSLSIRISKEKADLVTDNQTQVEEAFAMLYKYYSICQPRMKDIVDQALEVDPSYKRIHVCSILHTMLRNYMPVDNPINLKESVMELHEWLGKIYGKITYRSHSGIKKVTKRDVLIGPMHILLLEKTADSAAAIASAPRNHHGIPCKPSKDDRNATPFRYTPTRAGGEAEYRSWVNTVDPIAAADLMDRSTNYHSHRLLNEAILSSPTPTAIDMIIDREVHPIGNSQPLRILRHVLECDGLELYQKPRNQTWAS
jgi:hypothetical protein